MTNKRLNKGNGTIEYNQHLSNSRVAHTEIDIDDKIAENYYDIYYFWDEIFQGY